MAGTLWGQRERSSRQPGASSYLNGFPWQSLMESVPGQQQGLGPGKRRQRRPLRQGAGVPGGWAGAGGQRVDPWLRNLQPGGKPCGWLRTAIRSAARCAPRPELGGGEKPIPHLHWWKEEISSGNTDLLAKGSSCLVGGSAKPAGSFSPVLPSPAVCWCKGH